MILLVNIIIMNKSLLYFVQTDKEENITHLEALRGLQQSVVIDGALDG